jgi:competence protein ComEC
LIRRAPLLAAAVAFLAGVGIRDAPGLPPAIALSAAGALLIPPFLGPRRPRAGLAAAAVLVAFFLAGMAAPAAAPRASPALAAALRSNRPLRMVGRVRGIPADRDDTIFLRLAAERLDGRRAAGEGILVRLPRGITAAASRVEGLLPGDRVRIVLTLRRPRSFGNPGAFDYGAHLRRLGILALGWSKSPLLVERLQPGRELPARWVGRLRGRLLRGLGRAVRQPHARGLLGALLLGDRSDLAPEDRERLVRAGTFHLIAVSGLHVGLLAWFVLAAGSVVGLRNRCCRGLALGLLPVYAALTGAGAPVVRAAWMVGFLIAGGLLSRGNSAPNALGAAALLTLAPRPEGIQDPGLQLSFAATAAILLLSRGPVGRRGGRLPGVLAVSGAAFLGVAPLLARSFHRIAPIGILASALCAPLAAAALLAGALAMSLESLVPGLGGPPGRLAGWITVGMLRLAALGEAVPLGSWPTPGPGPAVLVGYYVLLLAACHRGTWTARLRPVLRALLGFALGAVLAGAPGHPARRIELYLLDVGQGESIVLRLPEGIDVLVDGGGLAGTRLDIGAAVVAPALWALGVRRLHRVIVTHPDRDHAGGIPAILERFPVGGIWIPPDPTDGFRELRSRAAGLGIPIREVTAGERAVWSGAEVTVLNPPSKPDAGAPDNERSVVLRVRREGTCLLLTGDAGRPAEARLVEAGLGPCDVLKVGHHGSRSGTGRELLEALRPRLALVSAGAGNSWGHPDLEVLRRLARARVRVLRTDVDGMVSLTIEGRVIGWSTFRARGDE